MPTDVEIGDRLAVAGLRFIARKLPAAERVCDSLRGSVRSGIHGIHGIHKGGPERPDADADHAVG